MEPEILEHPLPRRDCGPYICAESNDGALWVSENKRDRIARFDVTSTDWHEFALPRGSAPVGLAPLEGGVTANASNKIGRMLPSGKMKRAYRIPTPAAGARCIVAHSGGRLYFTEYDAGIVAEIRLPARS